MQGTGYGKTAVAAGPHAHPAAKGMVTFMVSPLIALQEEQASTFESEFHLTAKALNSAHEGLNKNNLSGVREGKWQIVVLSPEMLLSKVFVTQVIRHPAMAGRILSVVVDEAHVVSHWGSGFRKKYGTLGILKALLPRGTPFVAMSATLAPRVREDVLNKLQFNRKAFIDLDLGNDRNNVSIIIRAMHHAMNTYRDLKFLIPAILRRLQDIKKAFVYADTIRVATDIENYLYSLCPEAFRFKGFIRPYSAAFSVEYRAAVMEQFRSGQVRILICTDAAGMGCNIPDIDIVVQWKLPVSVSSFVQRAGRAARGPGRTGLAVLLVEKSVYEADILSYLGSSAVSTVEGGGEKKKKKRKGNVRESTTYPKPEKVKEYAEARGVLRGGYHAVNDSTGDGTHVALDALSIDEGLYSLVQTGTCRRAVLTVVFKNKPPEPTVPCCDNCDPALLNQTRPAPPESDKRASNPRRGVPNVSVMDSLHVWRAKIAKRDHGKAFFSGSGILSDDTVELLSSIGPIPSEVALKKLLEGKWLWLAKYQRELFIELTRLNIPPKVLKPKPQRPSAAAKRTHDEMDDGGNNEEIRRVRPTTTTTAAVAPTGSQAVIPRATPAASNTQPQTPQAPRNVARPSTVAHSAFQQQMRQHVPYYPPSTPARSVNPYMAYVQTPQPQTPSNHVSAPGRTLMQGYPHVVAAPAPPGTAPPPPSPHQP
ncbi:ATP-dependent DNA helicase RecQ [Ephemerocybe angulata]|uniref:DNA 3'-5' helicase n=1 Tax=Ephemerocybe angulata TaxID=980116 RepID=A0A8H6H9X1_9AGAR|nr:ATP-dependent DNA helicase RecQ [Tulosesus angulatus]